MPDYRAYAVNKDNYIVGAPTVMTCDTDADALAKARQIMDGYDVEVWLGKRRVGRVNTENTK